MKRENIFISENRTAKRVAATKFIAPGDVPAFDCLIRFGKEENDVTMQNCIIKDSAIVKCSPDDTYDFEVGALIALMKMCGVDKVVRACNEAFSEDTFKTYATMYERELIELKKDSDKVIDELIEENEKLKADKEKSLKIYQRNVQKKQDRINELQAQIKASEDDKQKNIEYYEKEIKNLNYRLTCKDISLISKDKKISIYEKRILALEAENKKLKLDCEKLQHGYIDTDMMFCGGRQNGKQYTFLVDLFKKIDQKKVDEAYKEAYNTKLPLWQKEVLNQMYGVYKESKEKTELPRTLDINGVKYRKMLQIKDFGEQINKLTVDSLIEQSRAFTRKCVDEWLYRIPTKREEMWEKILGASKCPPVEIKVAKEDITTFLRELQDKIPEVMWNGSDCPPTENIVPWWFKHNYIYFALIRNEDRGKLKLCYSKEHHSWIKTTIVYLPPMRWDLFKKGRIAVKVTYNNCKEFYEACERELDKKPSTPPMLWDGVTISICKKDGNFEIFTIEHQKKTGRKIVDWEDVR